MNISTLMLDSSLTRTYRNDLPCFFAKSWRTVFTLLLVFGLTLVLQPINYET